MRVVRPKVRIYVDKKKQKVIFYYTDSKGNYLFSRSFDFDTIKKLYNVDTIDEFISLLSTGSQLLNNH